MTSKATVSTLSAVLEQSLASALAVADLPGMVWLAGDDKCDCVFQRIGFWTNPYLAQTLEIRLCCVWGEFKKQWPQFFRETAATWNLNTGEWDTEPREWDSPDMAMPVEYWYRQIAHKTGQPIAEVRAEYRHKMHLRPKANPKAKQIKPTKAQLNAAHEKEQRGAGWLIEGEPYIPR